LDPQQQIAFLYRSKFENQGWKALQMEINDDEAGWEGIPRGSEVSGLRVRPEDIADYYVDDNKAILVDLASAKCDLSEHVFEAMFQIDESVRGDFTPTGIDIRVGWHDVFEFVEKEEGELFGRAFASVMFLGSGIPPQLQEFRRQLFELNAVRETKRTLGEIMEDIQARFYCSES